MKNKRFVGKLLQKLFFFKLKRFFLKIYHAYNNELNPMENTHTHTHLIDSSQARARSVQASINSRNFILKVDPKTISHPRPKPANINTLGNLLCKSHFCPLASALTPALKIANHPLKKKTKKKKEKKCIRRIKLEGVKKESAGLASRSSSPQSSSKK